MSEIRVYYQKRELSDGIGISLDLIHNPCITS